MYRVVLYALSTFLLFQCQEVKPDTNNHEPSTNTETAEVQPPSGETERVRMISFALKHLDIPYDASNNEGFDCSGFVLHCHQHIGISVPRSSKTQALGGKAIKLSDLELGDVLVFTGSDSSLKEPGHTGMVSHISEDTIEFIHSTIGKGIMLNSMNDEYYKTRYLIARRYLP